MEYKYLLIILFGIILVLPLVSAGCTQSGVPGIYSVGEQVVATISCAASDKGDIINYTWYNQTGEFIESDILTVPQVSPFIVFASWTVTSDYAPTNNSRGNFTEDGVHISGAYFNTTLTGGVYDLDIINVEVTSEIYEGTALGIKGKVQSQGVNVGGALVCIDALDENGEPFATIQCKRTGMDGEFFISGFCDPARGWCLGGKSYILDMGASCSLNRTYQNDICVKDDGTQVERGNGDASIAIYVIDVEDKMIINKTVNLASWTGIWVEDENGYRVNMTESLTDIQQEDIDWSIYSQVDGNSFLTAGEKFRVCINANNTFEDAKHILISDLLLIKYPGHLNYPLWVDGTPCNGGTIMHLEIQVGAYEKCSSWLKVPSYIKGQNKYKINFHIKVEGYGQDFTTSSNRFTIFGERTDTDYIDYLTLNNVEFTKDNATEGEYVQFRLNITNNHPFKNVPILAKYQLFSNWNFSTFMRFIDTTPYNLLNYINPVETFFTQSGIFPKNTTAISYSPRFKIPYGLIEQDIYDIIAGAVIISSNGNDIKWPTPLNPTIDIIDYDLEITNITTTISNTEATACDPFTITVTYNDITSDTNAHRPEDQLFVMKGWIEDTTNDFYIGDIDILFQPDRGIGDTFNFTTTLPYIGPSGTIESEIDIKFYTFDESNTDPDCTNCGELVFQFSGDEGDGIFNITANPDESCKYMKQSVVWEDDNLYNNYLMRKGIQDGATALEGIENKTGVFNLEIDCKEVVNLGGTLECDITAYLENDEVNKEVDFTCYVEDEGNEISSINFNKMVTRTPWTVKKRFKIPTTLEQKQYVLQCHADYYNLGSRRDSFYDSFIVRSEGFKEEKEELTMLGKIFKWFDNLLVWLILIILLIYITSRIVDKKRGINLNRGGHYK